MFTTCPHASSFFPDLSVGSSSILGDSVLIFPSTTTFLLACLFSWWSLSSSDGSSSNLFLFLDCFSLTICLWNYGRFAALTWLVFHDFYRYGQMDAVSCYPLSVSFYLIHIGYLHYPIEFKGFYWIQRVHLRYQNVAYTCLLHSEMLAK